MFLIRKKNLVQTMQVWHDRCLTESEEIFADTEKNIMRPETKIRKLSEAAHLEGKAAGYEDVMFYLETWGS